MTGKETEPTLAKRLIAVSQIGIQIVISTFVGLAIGYAIDRFFHTSPIFTMLFLLLGIIAGFIELYRTAQREIKRDAK